jgi:hypothetical protein
MRNPRAAAAPIIGALSQDGRRCTQQSAGAQAPVAHHAEGTVCVLRLGRILLATSADQNEGV